MTLNDYIAIYRKTQTKDSHGTLVTSLVLLGNEYAKVYPKSGGERNQSDQTEGYALYRFWIHQRGDLLDADTIQWNSVNYNIKFVADNGPLEPYMYIDAERGGAV